MTREYENGGMPRKSLAARSPLRSQLRRTLFLFHIGKTGGTSLIRHFGSAAERNYIQQHPDDFSAIDAIAASDDKDLIAGHFPVAPILPHLPVYWTSATVIRDPSWHLPSSYWHLRTHATENVADGLRQLITACRTAELGELLDGTQTELFQTHFDNPQTRSVLGKKNGPLHDDDLREAVDILLRLDFVGTTERLDDFARKLAAEFRWAASLRASEVPRIMVNPYNRTHASVMPETTKRAIRELTALDAELYRTATTLQAGWLRRLPPIRRPAVAPPHRPSALPVSDMIRVLPVTLANVRLGHELRITGEDFLLHPPPAADGRAVLAIDGIPLDQHVELSGRLVVANDSAGLVRYTIELVQAELCHACAAFVVGPRQPLDIRLRFGPISGTSRLILSTQMAKPGAANSYAWANFSALTLS